MIKKISSILLAILIVFSLAGQAALATEDTYTLTNRVLDSLQYTVFQESEDSGVLRMSHLDRHGNTVKPSFLAPAFGMFSNRLPAKYDLRDYGRSTSVKHQDHTNFCWAYSSMASVESNILTQGLFVPAEWKTNGELALSPSHIGSFAFDEGSKEGLSGDFFGLGNHGSRAGNIYCTTALMATGAGPQLEKEFPSSLYRYGKNENHRYASYYTLDDMYYIPFDYSTPESDANDTYRSFVKTQIMENGAATISYYGGAVYYGTDKNGSRVASCYSPDQEGNANHSVTVIGWDDEFNTFAPQNAPKKPGAWLVKESYGSARGENGYLWVSYYDPSIVEMSGITVQAGGVYDNIYQYDGVVPSAMVVQKAANIFTPKQDETLQSVGFYTFEHGVSYTIEVYTDLQDSKNPESGTKHTTEGVSEFRGYTTATLDSPVSLKQGQPYSVVVTLTFDDAPSAIGIEVPYWQMFDGVPMAYESREGESFIYETWGSGETSWADTRDVKISGNAGDIVLRNVAIKAFTTNSVAKPVDKTALTAALSTANSRYSSDEKPTDAISGFWDIYLADKQVAEAVNADDGARQYQVDNAAQNLTASLEKLAMPTVAHISTKDEFVALTNQIANFEPCAIQTIYLDRDITINVPHTTFITDGTYYYGVYEDVTPVTTRPMGTKYDPFFANFDGQGHTITGLYIDGGDDTGLVGVLSGTISDLTISDSFISGGSNLGGFAGIVDTDGVIDDCTLVNTTIMRNSDTTTNTGGIAGVVLPKPMQTANPAGRTLAVKNAAVTNGFIMGTKTVGGVIGQVNGATGTENLSFDGMVVGEISAVVGEGLGTEIGAKIGEATNLPYYSFHTGQREMTLFGSLIKDSNGLSGEVIVTKQPAEKEVLGFASKHCEFTDSYVAGDGSVNYPFTYASLGADELLYTGYTDTPVVQQFDGVQYVTLYTPGALGGKQVIVAEYNQNKELVAIKQNESFNLEKGANQLDISGMLSQVSGNFIKIMVWESTETVKPLSEVIKIPKQ